jgi:hypothetical protein
MKGTYLITEFRDKDAVKSLGARWDPLRRQVVRTPRNRSSGLCQLAARCRSGLCFRRVQPIHQSRRVARIFLDILGCGLGKSIYVDMGT